MSKPITIETIELTGFRAYLRQQSFALYRGQTPLSLAVFAPNAKGKSSLVDAIEFYFSEDATLRRLGIRAADRNAGRTALEHTAARDKGVTPVVGLSFRQGNEKFGDVRPVTQAGAPLPPAASRVLSECTLPFVIRGHELRSFVERRTSEDRYEEIVTWFGLQPLLAIQKNLRALRRQVKQNAESTTERDERLRDLARTTANAVKTWDETAICKWFNEQLLAKLDKALTIAVIAKDDAGYQELVKRKGKEEERLGLASLKRFHAQTEALHQESANPGESPSGAVVAFERAIAAHATAVAKEAEERAKASQTIFNDVWTAAKKLFESKDVPLEACPVCETQFSATPHGTRNAIQLKLGASLGQLAAYRTAESALKAAEQTLSRSHRTVVEGIAALTASLKDTTYAKDIKSLGSYHQSLTKWKIGDGVPDSASALAELKALLTSLSVEKKRIEEQQGDRTYATALKTADDLIKLKGDLERIDRTKSELVKLNTQLNQQAQAINKAIVEHTQKLIGALKSEVNTLYKEIQGNGQDAPPIRLDLPDDDDTTNKQRIQLLIDFADNRKGVVPSGYLSDSQIHTLALGLRLAAIRLFNKSVPIIVLDDIVTSYDADHRKNIAAMFAKHFGGYQIILFTHDERFFNLLQDHLPQGAWSYRRIIEIKPDFGPTFHDHRTPDAVIQAKLDSGQSAGNEIRQAEEEWLLDMCRAFRVKVVIRPIDRPYKYDRSELAGALAAFLKGAGVAIPQVEGIANPFLVSLQKGDIENFASHFSDNPNEAGSVGDEKTRWNEFTSFRGQFVCSGCGGARFIRPDTMPKPVCKKCQAPFNFKAPAINAVAGA